MNVYVLMYNADGPTMTGYLSRENAIRALHDLEKLHEQGFTADERWDHKTYDSPQTGFRSIYVCSEGSRKTQHTVFSVKTVPIKDSALEALAAQAE